MTTPMSMNRVIHAAIRRDLARFDRALTAFPDGDARRAAELGKAWRYLHGELTRHHTGEHEIAWPALRQVGVSAETLAAMDAEHDRLAEALDAAADSMRTLENGPASSSAAAAASAMANLSKVAEEHMAHEEAEIEPVYTGKKDDPAIKAMGRRFSKVDPLTAGKFFAWLENGASAEERASLRDSVPGPVITILGRLFGLPYHRTIAPVWEK